MQGAWRVFALTVIDHSPGWMFAKPSQPRLGAQCSESEAQLYPQTVAGTCLVQSLISRVARGPMKSCRHSWGGRVVSD